MDTNDFKIKKLSKVIQYKIEVSDNYLKTEYVKNITGAYEKGIKINNCHLCRYHGLTKWHNEDNDHLVFCKFKKHSVNSNEAAECDYYKIDRTKFTIIEDGNLTTASS